MISRNKILLSTLAVSSFMFSQSSYSAPPSNVDMSAMMGKMQEMQACMSKIDQEKLKSLQKKAMGMHKKIQSLCDDGKTDEAQKTAMEFAIQMKDSPELTQMRDCTKDMPAMMKEHMMQPKVEEMNKEFSQKDICEAMQEKKRK